MRILLLTQVVPYPLDAGPKVKTFNVLRYLAGRGHRVTLVSFVRKNEERFLKELAPFCERIYSVPLRRSRWADCRAYTASLRLARPFLVLRDAIPEMHDLLRKLTAQQTFDYVHADQLTMGQFAFEVRGALRVLDAHNAVWKIVERARQTVPFFLQPILAREAQQLKRYEGELCRQMDTVLAVSSDDQRALVEAGANSQNIKVIPIAIDGTRLKPVLRAKDSTNILSVSTLSYPPNADGIRWFLREVLPRIRGEVPEVTVTLVGAHPPKDIVRFGSRNPAFVNVTGYVTDLQPYLESAALMVVPVRIGSGMRVRILEALARGMAVVTTRNGIEGIEAVDGEHLLVADSPAEFSEAVVRLLKDSSFSLRLGKNGRKLVQERYDWRVVLPQLDSVYEPPMRVPRF
jgi:polysaccharide biosynthesis protein PslH